MKRRTTLIGAIVIASLLAAASPAVAEYRTRTGTPNDLLISRTQERIPGGLFSPRIITCTNVRTQGTIQKSDTDQGAVLVGGHLLNKIDESDTCTMIGWFSTSSTATSLHTELQFGQNGFLDRGMNEKVVAPVQIKVTGKGGGICTVTIPVTAENEHVGSFEMENVGKEVHLKGEATGLVGEGEESALCKENEVNGQLKDVQMKQEAEYEELDAVTSPEAGPYWRHREGASGGGSYIEARAPETVEGSGGEQKLTGEISSIPVEISAKEVSAKGIVYNNNDEGQLKLTLTYHEPKLVKPAMKECTVKLGEANVVTVAGHLAWKWDGTKKQLEEETQAAQTPYIVLDPAGTEIKEGAAELPKGQFTTITFSSCGLLAGKFKMEGSATDEPKPLHIEEWSKAPSLIGLSSKEQEHFSNGEKFIGAEPELSIGEKTASLLGTTELKATKQEVAIFES